MATPIKKTGKTIQKSKKLGNVKPLKATKTLLKVSPLARPW